MQKSNYKVFRQLIEKETGETITPEFKFHPSRKWRFDFAIQRLKIAIEIEGAVWQNGRHTRGYGFIADTKKYNAATSLGWAVLRFSSTLIYTQETIQIIKETVRLRDNKQ